MSVATSVIVGIAVAVVVAGAAVATAVVQKNAADKAAGAQKDAVKQQSKLLKKLDPNALNDLATKFDKQRAKARLDFQKEIDPQLAELREKSKEQLLEDSNINPKERQSGQLATKLFDEVKQEDPRIEAFKSSLIGHAQDSLDAGATLPPEFQAELVRSGLNEGSQAGISLDANGIGGRVARVTGLAGLKLQQEQQDRAIQFERAAQDITTSRVNILSAVFPKLRDLETVNHDQAARDFALSNAALPEVGLSGQDAVNIQIAKTKGQAGLAQQRGNIKAGEAIAQGQYQGQLIGAGASLVSGVAGAYGGGGAGALSSAGGTSNYGGVNVGQYGSRTPTQQSNYNMLQSYYE